jgi:hypothetical protein
MADPLFKIRVEGVEAVKANLDLTKKSVRTELEAVVSKAAGQAVAQAQANLSGRVLKRHTGQTAGAVRSFPISGEGFVTANVGVGPEGYRGKFWERGFNGAQDVKQHLRAIKTGRKLQVMKVSRKGRVSRVKTYETGAIEVSAYTRKVDGSPRPWLAPAVASVSDSFRNAVLAIADKKREV